MKLVRAQKGLSVLGWLVVLAIVAFFATTGMKILPHYMDYMTLDKTIKNVETDKAAQVTTVPDFYTYVEKAMGINNMNGIDLRKAMTVVLENDKFSVHLKYERREPLIANMDLVVRFDHQYTVSKP